MRAKYVNPFTDFGFKKIFGEEASKPMLMDFLNALLPEENRIVELTFKTPEQLGRREFERKAVFDIYCENERGQKFIVELQKAKQNYFVERTIYYSTFPIREQAEKGNWNYNLEAVYCIGILDFTFGDYTSEAERHEVVHTVKLKDQNGEVFYDKLTYIYLEMPNFKKEEHELVTRLDQWLFFIKNLEDFQSIPHIFRDSVFTQAFEKAELAKLDNAEMDSYEYSLKVFRDNKAVWDYALETATAEARTIALEEGKAEGIAAGKAEGIAVGKAEGIIEGKLEVARELFAKGIPLDVLVQTTGFSSEEIQGTTT